MDVKGKKIFVGLSGGVDSAVTAALLERQGASVTGVFIKGWYPPGMPCTWSADRRDAMRVAAHLQIPFYTLDASKEYKEAVIDYLLAEYRAGRTPNPDIMCNREVKFGAFYRYAASEGADYIATGHYARIEHAESGPILRCGASDAKDQSYFLWAVPRAALLKTLFPLGELEKEEVRKLARQFTLPVSDKPDSQGICFLGEVSVADFLSHELGSTTGEAKDEAGQTVGTHDGALLYTLGERVALNDADSGPWFVVAKDVSANTLTVAKERIGRKPAATAFTLRQMNVLAVPETGKEYEAQYRYHGPRVRARVEDGLVRLTRPAPDHPAEGQSLVIYDGDRLIGGGIIASGA